MASKRNQQPKYPLVRVEWQDAESDSDGWTDIRQITDSPTRKVVSIGWLIKKEPTRLVLASDLGMNDTDCGRRLTIPRAWVDKLTTL